MDNGLAIDCRTIGLLVQSQTQLRVLAVPVSAEGAPDCGLLSNNLQNLSYLCLSLRTSDANYGAWFSIL